MSWKDTRCGASVETELYDPFPEAHIPLVSSVFQCQSLSLRQCIIYIALNLIIVPFSIF